MTKTGPDRRSGDQMDDAPGAPVNGSAEASADASPDASAELFRALAALAEPPAPADRERHRTLARALGLVGGSAPPDAPATAAEHTDLFSFELFPYASVYLGQQGMAGGEARDRIAGFWRVVTDSPVPAEPDHLVFLLALYAELAGRAGSAAEEEKEAWQRARRAFLWEHLVSWLPVYLIRVGEIGSPFFRRWADLLARALSDEAEAVGPQEALSAHLRDSRPIPEPAEDDGAGGAFLQALLAPARTGMILCRSDLRRAADELELGSRIGERRYVLEALFSQSPAGTLAWLGGEAERQNDLWRAEASRFPSFGEVLEHWSGRAEAAAGLLARLAGEVS